MSKFLSRFACLSVLAMVAVVLGVLPGFSGNVTAQAVPVVAAPAVQLVSQSTPATITPAATAAATRTVVKGDTMGRIAKTLGIKLKDLIAANPQVKDPDRIFPGDALNLPGAPAQLAPDASAPAAPPAQPEAQSAEWVHPFPEFNRCTSGFGPRWGRQHGGVDLANGRTGSPVLSIADGVVDKAGPSQGYGFAVVVKHDNGATSWYGHVKRGSIRVKEGQSVQAGQHIADVGNEGRSTGPHLHLTIVKSGKKIDPEPFLAKHGVHLCRDPR